MRSFTISEAEDAMGIPVKQWEGNCYGIALKLFDAMKDRFPEGSEVVYGMWHGPVHPDSIFAGKALSRHGWIVTPEGEICDPTRWAFEAPDTPFMYFGTNDEGFYDRGSSRFVEAITQPPPGPFDHDEEFDHFYDFGLATDRVKQLLKWDPEQGLTTRQAFWLANLTPNQLDRFYAGEIYEAFVNEGDGAMVPIDFLQEMKVHDRDR